jgi:hypothetical protein
MDQLLSSSGFVGSAHPREFSTPPGQALGVERVTLAQLMTGRILPRRLPGGHIQPDGTRVSGGGPGWRPRVSTGSSWGGSAAARAGGRAQLEFPLASVRH